MKHTSNEQIFSTAHLSKGLRHRSVRGGAVTAAAQVAKFVLRFGSTAILARILTPEDYGLIAMTAVVVGFIGLFKDVGLATATVQREEITHDQVSVLFWINVALGVLLALIIAALAPAVADFYRDPRLTPVVSALGLGFILSGFSVQHLAILRRQMQFATLAKLEIVSMIAGIGVAWLMAYAGFRFWSLVGMTLTTAAVNLAGVWLAVRWRPGRPKRGTGARALVKFGSDVLSVNIMAYFSRNTDNFLIAWCWGPVPLGLYEKAYNLLLFPIQQINSPMGAVAIPAMARLKSDRQELRRYFLTIHHLMASLSVPAIAGIALFADHVVRLWLGPQWLECAPIFRALSVGALIGAVSSPTGWLLLALGLSRRHRNAALVSVPLVILSFAYGLPYGPVGVAIGYSIVCGLLMIPSWAWTLHGTGIRVRDMLTSIGTPLASSLAAGAAAVAILVYAPAHWAEPYRALLAAGSFGLIYALMLLGVFRERVLLLKVWQALRGGSRAPIKTEPANEPA